ncbi:MAG: universal stress protein [Rubrivivax sp.]|nr:universal stress protein [Rubrivivax sp.]
MFKHILLPTDGSALSRRAAATGVELARTVGARVTALFVAPVPTPLVYEHFLPVAYMTPEEHEKLIQEASARYLGTIEKAAAAAGVPFEGLHVTSDYPADAIVKAAAKHKCDLIVMASHGRKGIKGLLLGSETAKVLAHATVPVMVHR